MLEKWDILADPHNFNRVFKGEDVVLRLRLVMGCVCVCKRLENVSYVYESPYKDRRARLCLSICVCICSSELIHFWVSLRDILQHLSNAVVDLITADQCYIYDVIFNGQPSAASLRRKLLTQAGLQASCFHIPTWLWEKGGKQGRRPMFVYLCSYGSTVLEMHPRFLFSEHHFVSVSSLRAETSQRDFWRGRAASYLTDLPMKSQTHSLHPQCHT